MHKIISLFCLLVMAGVLFPAFSQTSESSSMVELDYPPAVKNLKKVRKQIGYPTLAWQSATEGTVIVHVLVSPQGKYEEHKIVQDPHPDLTRAVVRHLEKLKFSPAEKAGKPIACWMEIPFDFKVEEKIYFSLEEALAHPERCIRLNLTGKELTALPPEISNLKNLKILDLSQNQLSDLPETLKKLSRLESLNLDRNPLTELPGFLTDLKSLKFIYLRETGIDKSRKKELRNNFKGITLLF